ncbi:hypothetical protein ACG7HM_000944 [Enterococcus hirae]|nr:hypothetical protein [Enterococcus hirae]
MKDLTPEEIKVVENLVSEKRLCLQLGREVGPELAVRYERSNQDNQVERLKLFNEMDQKVFSVTCRQFIKEQAKKCLSATNYTRFEVAQMIRNIERKKGLQEREKNNFFDPIINSQDLSSNEIRAYCLAYLEEQQMESNIKKNLRKPFLKELKPEEILKVKNLVSEKRLYLQLGKEVGPELATKLDNSKESDQVVLSQLFKEMDQKAFSVTCRQFIKEQAKKHLSEENYVRFEIGHVIREGESKKNLQEWEETDFLNPFLSRENLSPNEIRAYEIAYLEMKYEPFSQMNSWKKSLQQYFEKNLTSEERNEVQALVPQKRVLIQLSKELDLKNVFQLEEIQQGKQEGRLVFFTDIYEKSFSTTNQEYIKTQAKIYLSPANHAEFAVKSQMQDALREKGLKLANIKFREDKIRAFLDQKMQSPLEIRAYYLACIEEQVIPMDIKKSLIHALKKDLTVDENLKLSELISEQQRLIHLSEEIGPERTLEFLKIKKENKAATIDFFTDLYNNVSSYTQQWIKEQASLHLNQKEHLEFTKKIKLKEIIKEGGPDLKASAVYNQSKRVFEKAMSLPVIEELQVKNGLQQVNANLLDPLELRRLNKEQLIDSLVKVQVRFPHWEQRLKDQAIDRSISHLNDLEKKEIKTSLKVKELKGFLNKVKFHDSDGFSSIWGYAKFHVDNDRRIIKLQKIKEQLDEIAPANLLQPVVVKILTNNRCDYRDLKLREAIVSHDETAIEINRQLKSEFKAMGVTFKEVSRNQILRRIFKNLDKGLKSEKEQIAEVLSDSNLHYNNLLNTLLVQFEKKVHEYIPYLDTLIQKDYEDKGDVSLTNKRILELVENEPGLKDLLVCCQNMLPSYPLKNYAQTIPMVSTYFANLAHQIEETYQSPGKKLAKQIFMLGKLDPLYCAKMIQYLSAQYTNKQPNPLPIHPNILIQNKMEKIVESYHDLYPLPSMHSELTGKKVVNKVANEVVGNVERPISTPIIEQSSQPFDWSPSVILNQEVRPTETAKAIVAFHNKYHDLEMTKQFTAFATKPRLEREKDKTNTTKEESLKEVAYQEFLKKKKSYKKSKNSAGREIAHEEMELALKKYQHVVQKKQDQKECANNMENQELVRAGVYLTQQLQSDELTNYLVERMIAPENRRPANVQLQYFIKELVHDLNTATEREAAIQTIMQPYLSVEERQKFYAFMKQDTYLQQFLKQENLSKIELKACVSACLHKSDLPFKEQVDQKLDVFLTDKEQRQLKEMVSQKEIVRVLAEQRDYETAVKFEKVLKKEEVGEINWLVSIYDDTPFLLIKESITSLIDSSFNEADRMQFYNKINSNHKLKDLSKQVSLTTAEGENSRSNKEDMFSLVSAISPEVAERIEATNLKRLPLIAEIKENLEEKGIKYYLPEIIKEIGKIDWNNHQGNSENELIKEKLRQVSITCSDEQIENWRDIFFDNFIEGIRIGDLNEQKEIRYFIDHEVSSKSEMIIYYLAYLEAKEIPSDLETIKNLKKNVATPNQIDIDGLILEKKQLLTIVNEIGPSAYERLRYDIGVSIGFFTEMYEKVNSVDTQQFIKNQAQLSLDAEKHLEFKKRIALYELSKSSKLTFEVDSFIQRQRHSQQKNGENYRTKISLEDIGRLREHNLSSLAERMVYVQKSTEEIESKKNDEPKSVKEELQVFLALISRFDDDDKYRYMDSHFENIYSSVKKKSHNGKHILSLPKKNKALTDENRSEFYQKIDSVAPINQLDQTKWKAPSTNKNVKQEKDRFLFSLMDEMKETLEQQKLVYYFPEIVKQILPPKIRNLEEIDKEYQITRERLEETGIHFTYGQMQKWIDTFDEGPIVNDNNHISILKTIAKVIEKHMERKGILIENIPTDKAENNIVKEELIAAIEQSVVKINKDDSDKSVEEKFRDHLSNYPIILNLIKEQPEIGKKLLKKCQDRLPFVSLTSSKEFREIVDNEFAIRNTNIRKFARKHAPQVRSQMTVEKQIYDLYQENPAWCCENLRAILVDYVGFKNINLNPIYRPKLYSFQACGNFDQWRLRGKAQKIINFYTGIASNLERVLPKELQEKEPVNKERQTEISLESIVTKHEKLNNDMVLTETNEKKKLFPATDYFESKSNLRQREPLIKKLHMTQIKEKASQEGYSSNERKTHEQVQRQANR